MLHMLVHCICNVVFVHIWQYLDEYFFLSLRGTRDGEWENFSSDSNVGTYALCIKQVALITCLHNPAQACIQRNCTAAFGWENACNINIVYRWSQRASRHFKLSHSTLSRCRYINEQFWSFLFHFKIYTAKSHPSSPKR